MTTVHTTLAKRLFDFIRNGKKALVEQLPPAWFSNTPGQGDREAMRSLVWQLQGFERHYRGAQKWLAGIEAPEHFQQNAARSALYLVHQLIKCQGQLTGPFWQEMLSIPGMHNGEFILVARDHIRGLLHDSMSAFVGVKAEFTDKQVLCMKLTNESATRVIEKPFPAPDVEGLSLEQQIVKLNSYWTEIKHAAREIAKEGKNWPTLEESRDIELADVEYIMKQFKRTLSQKDLALLRKHPDAVKAFINTL